MTGRQISMAAMTAALAAMLAGCRDQETQPGADKSVTNRPTPTVRHDVEPAPTARSIMQPSVIPEPEPTPPPLAPVSETIHFAAGGPRLDDAAKAALDQLIANPTTASGGAIILRGSSDSAGSDRDNLITSRKRGEAVAAYLEEKGIARGRLTIIALGEGRPVAPNINLDGSDNPEGRARNRRVDITVNPGSIAAAADGSKEAEADGSEPPMPAQPPRSDPAANDPVRR